jgi:hypothetical protein
MYLRLWIHIKQRLHAIEHFSHATVIATIGRVFNTVSPTDLNRSKIQVFAGFFHSLRPPVTLGTPLARN